MHVDERGVGTSITHSNNFACLVPASHLLLKGKIIVKLNDVVVVMFLVT